MNARLLWSIAASALILVSGPASDAQQTLRSSSDIVEVYATVKSTNGRGVHDLRGDEFELYEDGKRRDIAVFSAAVQPLSVALVLDHSGSTDAEFHNVLQASEEFVGRLFREDRAAVRTLSWDCVPFTSDPRALVMALRTKLPRDEGSPIWSATDRAMSLLVGEAGRRIILLFSDGQDNQQLILDTRTPPRAPAGVTPPAPAKPPAEPSRDPTHPCTKADNSALRKLNDVVDRAERDAVMVYSVAVEGHEPSPPVFGSVTSMGNGSPIGSGSSEVPPGGAKDLEKLAKRSGASLLKLKNYSEVKAAFKTIADELHLQYLLGFAPTKFDGKRHEIKVRVTRPGVTVRAREAYVARAR
jgi:VWFA-related protein